MSRKERDELWELNLDLYREIREELNSMDPSDENYDKVKKNLENQANVILSMAQEDKKLKWDKIKFCIGTGVGILQMGVGTFVTLIGLDWESANSMRSRFTPKVMDTVLPKPWRMPTDNR